MTPWRFFGLRMGDRLGVPAFVGIRAGAARIGAFLDEDSRLTLTGAMTKMRA